MTDNRPPADLLDHWSMREYFDGAALGRRAATDAGPVAISDPAGVFALLVREVDAGRALIAMTSEPGARRRAALDALALARDVLEDAAVAAALEVSTP